MRSRTVHRRGSRGGSLTEAGAAATRGWGAGREGELQDRGRWGGPGGPVLRGGGPGQEALQGRTLWGPAAVVGAGLQVSDQVGQRVQAVAFGAGEDGPEHLGQMRRPDAAEEAEVLAPDDGPAQDTLSFILDLAMIEKAW